MNNTDTLPEQVHHEAHDVSFLSKHFGKIAIGLAVVGANTVIDIATGVNVGVGVAKIAVAVVDSFNTKMG